MAYILSFSLEVLSQEYGLVEGEVGKTAVVVEERRNCGEAFLAMLLLSNTLSPLCFHMAIPEPLLRPVFHCWMAHS